jgi:hypothetical protein
MIKWEGFVMNRSRPYFKALSWLKKLGKITKPLSQNRRYLGRYLSPGPSKYKARVLNSRPRRSVTVQYVVELLFFYLLISSCIFKNTDKLQGK